MAFKIPKATSADDIAVWYTGAKQQLEDYFAQLPASQWDEYVPLQKANPEIPVAKYQNLESVARQAGKSKGLQDDALDNYVLEQMRPHLVTLTPEERAREIQLLIDGEKRNYLQDIERQAKRFGYKPETRRVEEAISGGDIDTSFVPENTPTQRRSANVLVDTPQPQVGFNPETLLPEGVKLDVAIAIAKQNAVKKFPNNPKQENKQFFKEMEAQGIVRDVATGQWVDRRIIGEWGDIGGGKTGRTVDKSKLDAMRASYGQSALEQTPQMSSPASNATIEAVNPASGQSLLDSQPQAVPLPSNTEAEAILNDLDNLILNPQPQPTPQEVPGTTAFVPTNVGAIAPEAASVLSTQPGMPVTPQPEVVISVPQYEGNSSVATAPPSGVNNAVYPGSKAVGTSSDLPGGGNYDFEGEEFNRQNNYTSPGGTPNHPEIPGLNDPADPDANLKWLWERNQREAQAREQYLNNKAREEANTGNYWQNLWDGTKRGFDYAVKAGKYPGRSASVGWNRAPEDQYAHLQDEGKFGFGVGRVVGDVIGNGSRQVLWNLHPADFVGTHGAKWLGEDASKMAQVVVPFAAVTGLELGSQIYNPFNLGQGGRVAGYAAINPDDEDPRISTSPVSELLIDRGLLGKRGRLLPWEQFRQERTDIPYEQYEKYQNYLRNKDENFLRDATGGLVKGTLDGINGPELSIMGYSVTPTGALAAGAALLAGRELVRTGRIAGFRK